MSEFLEKIKETWHGIRDKYYIEVSYSENKRGVPTVVAKDYLVYNDQTGESEFTTDLKKATCFDFHLGAPIVLSINRQFIVDPNMRASLVSVADAHFINDITGTLSSAYKNALTPQEKAKYLIAEEKVKQLAEYLKRVDGINGIGVVITLVGQDKIAEIEISVADLMVKTHLFTMQNDATRQPLFIQDAGGAVTYDGIPVKIIVQPMAKAL